MHNFISNHTICQLYISFKCQLVPQNNIAQRGTHIDNYSYFTQQQAEISTSFRKIIASSDV